VTKKEEIQQTFLNDLEPNGRNEEGSGRGSNVGEVCSVVQDTGCLYDDSMHPGWSHFASILGDRELLSGLLQDTYYACDPTSLLH
jgi:hypothetical protein